MRALLGSRKFVAAITFAVLSLASIVGARFGLDWNAEAATATAVPWILLGLSNIFGIAMEDAASKSIGAGTTTTQVVEPTAGGQSTTTVIAPDPTRKP